MRTRFLAASCVAFSLAAFPSQAQLLFNQSGNGQMGGGPVGGGGGGGSAPPPKVPLPPGLPGAASNKGAAPPAHAPTDMEPTDALFDAINRGDISAARDAISRGADLHGRNVLDMTPLELSVDLGRNDISFLLLSMRGAGEPRARQAPPEAMAAKGKASKQARQMPPHAPSRVAAPAHAPAQNARLFAGDGGAPNPGAGFLGFGSPQR